MSSALLDLLDPPFPLLFRGIIPSGNSLEMTKARLSRECAICERPFTVFTWVHNGVPFRTRICQICAKAANVCQVSLLDLDLGIPVIVRNKLIGKTPSEPTSKQKRWFENRTQDRQISNSEDPFDTEIQDLVKKIDPNVAARAAALTQADPYLSMREPPVCVEWLKGECIHGESCFFRHEIPKRGEYPVDNTKFGVRCRFLGTVDPNGERILEQLLAETKDVRMKKSAIEGDSWESKTTEEKGVSSIPRELISLLEDNEPPPYEGLGDFDLPEFRDGELVG
mgnify:CR=1 FL=1